MTERETLALQGLLVGNVVSWDMGTSTDTYVRPNVTVTVRFDAGDNVTAVNLSDGLVFQPTLENALRAIGALQ